MKKHLILIGIIFVLLIVGFSGCIDKGENILLNSGFEEGKNDELLYWFQAIIPDDNLTMLWDKTVFYNGSYSVGINNTHIYDNDTCNNWAQEIDEVPIGRIIELSGWVKTIESEDVAMVIQCWDDENNIVGFGTTEVSNNINGTNDWNEYNASVFVPIKTKKIIVRLALCDTGEVWFDDVKLIVK